MKFLLVISLMFSFAAFSAEEGSDFEFVDGTCNYIGPFASPCEIEGGEPVFTGGPGSCDYVCTGQETSNGQCPVICLRCPDPSTGTCTPTCNGSLATPCNP